MTSTSISAAAASPKPAPLGLESPGTGDAPVTKAEAKAIAKEEAKFSEFVVLLDDQATRTVEKAFSMPMGLERRQHVVASLIDNMVKTQGPLWKVLDGLQEAGHVSERRGYTPLWIQNSIVVYGDETARTVMESAAGVTQAVKSANHLIDPPGKHTDQLAPIEDAVGGASAILADLPVDVAKSGEVAKAAAAATGKGKGKSKPDLSKDPQWNLARVQIEKAQKEGLTGKGVTVGVIDTGVDYTHPALLNSYRGYDPATGEVSHVGNWYDATDEKSEAPVDDHSHGTHVDGTIVGKYGEMQVGAAPDAKWVAARGLGKSGGTDGMLLSSFQNMVAPRVPVAPGEMKRVVALGPDIINNSWGSDDGSSTSYMHALRNMDAMGVVNFFAAGNDGEAGKGTIGSPGSSPHIITVGATDRKDDPATFTAQGPNPLPVEGGEPVPYVALPGTEIRSTVPGGGYGVKQGTSMASPLGAGIGALIEQAAVEETGRKFDTRAMKEVMKRLADDVAEKGPDDVTGHGIPELGGVRATVRDVAKDLGLLDAPAPAPAPAPEK